MSTQIVPTGAQKAVARIDQNLTNGVATMKNFIANVEKNLTSSVENDGTKLTQDQVIAAGGDRYANLLSLIASAKATVNIAVPGTYAS